MKRHECTDPFLRGYLDAALFTTDPSHGSGDYVQTGRADDMFERIPDAFIAQAKADCADFEESAAELLKQAGDFEQNGHDFWLTRNHHGAGFWDRGYGDAGRELTELCRPYGDHDLELGGWFIQEYRCKCGECWTRPEDATHDPEFGSDKCDACGATVESLNRQQGEHLTACDEPSE